MTQDEGPGLTGGPAREQPVWQVVALAGRAPSTHNTQPWAWRLGDDWLELHADRERQLRHVDPAGRDLVMSCGAALHHAIVAAHALGLAVDVVRFPDGPDSDCLARVSLSPGRRGAEEVAELVALGSRRTDRRRFTSWPVPEAQLEQLATVARSWGGHATAVLDLAARWRVDTLLAQAHRIQAASVDVVREHDQWLDHSDVDGVPRSLVPEVDELPDARAPRFGGGRLVDRHTDLEPGDGVLVLGGPADDAPSWLATGLGLSALWLRAERSGLSVVPLSQVTEVAETQEALGREVFDGRSVAHLVVRVGWRPISRRELPRSPRRSLDEIVRP